MDSCLQRVLQLIYKFWKRINSDYLSEIWRTLGLSCTICTSWNKQRSRSNEAIFVATTETASNQLRIGPDKGSADYAASIAIHSIVRRLFGDRARLLSFQSKAKPGSSPRPGTRASLIRRLLRIPLISHCVSGERNANRVRSSSVSSQAGPPEASSDLERLD